MSALRLGRLPDGTRDIRILEPAVGRITHSRLGIRNGSVAGAIAVGGSGKVRIRDRRAGGHRKVEPWAAEPKDVA